MSTEQELSRELVSPGWDFRDHTTALRALTGAHLLPFVGEQCPGLDAVPGDGAVVVEATAPAQLDGGVTDVSHHHTPRGPGGSWGEGERWTCY